MTSDSGPQSKHRRKEVGMKDIVTTILTDESVRDTSAVEAALTQQATAIPWAGIDQ